MWDLAFLGNCWAGWAIPAHHHMLRHRGGAHVCVCVCVCDPLMTPLLPPFCMTFCLSSELSVMQVMHVMLSFFATGVDIKVFVLPAQGQGLPILKLVPYFTFCK